MNSIYRYKFSSEFLEVIKQFASTHRYDDTEQFRDNWEEWVIENNESITREDNRLSRLGYIGNVKNKMFKSARYYFKNKSLEKNEPVKRQSYVSLNKDLLKFMDKHILENGQNIKPSDAYEDFINDYIQKNTELKNLLDSEKNRIKNMNFNDDIIEFKFKKTYKNRYQKIQKSLLKD